MEAREPCLQSFSGQTMGTTYEVRLVLPRPDDALLVAARAAVHDALQGVDARMSTYRPDSEISLLNAHASGQALPLSADTLQVLSTAGEVSRASAGAFDVTVGRFVNEWGFGPHKRDEVADARSLAAWRSSVGHAQLEVDLAHGTATKADPRLYVDLSAIAKGFGVDRAACALDGLGIADHLVEVGGEIRASGRRHDGRPWQVGIEEPLPGAPRRARYAVPLRDQSMATSGDYRICFERNGRRYSHEIDPRTGRPIANGLTSVTVVAHDCAIADAFATALIVLGAQEGPLLARRLGIAAYFVVREADGQLRDILSPAFAALQGRRLHARPA